MKAESIVAIIASYYTKFRIRSYSSLPVPPADLRNSFYFQFSSFIENEKFDEEKSYKDLISFACDTGLNLNSSLVRSYTRYIALSLYLNLGIDFCEEIEDQKLLVDIEDISEKYQYLYSSYLQSKKLKDKEWVEKEVKSIMSQCSEEEYLLRKGILIGLSSVSFIDMIRSGLYLGIEDPIIMLVAYHVSGTVPDKSLLNLHYH